ncbi:MAG: 2-oxo acid dehydrogenase subunit E2 [Eubacteriales bacterium]
MIKTVIMPKQGLQMTEGVITKWFYNAGDRVFANKPLFQMETDKLTIDIDAQCDGILLQIIRNEGETVLITEPIAFIGSEEDIIQDNPVTETVLSAENNSLVIFATPRAKRTASERGINYKNILGSGYNGIVIERDILNAKLADVINTIPPEVKPAEKPILMQKINHTCQSEIKSSKVNQPKDITVNSAQAYHRVKADITGVLKLTNNLKQYGINTGASAAAAYAAIKTISSYPHMNGDSKDINLGIIIPCADEYKITVINNAECLTLTTLSESINIPDIKHGNTVFAFADFGKFDTDESFIPLRGLLCAILTAGAVSEVPAVSNGTLFLRPMMTLTLTYDYNKINDFYASEFLQHIKFLIENPNLLFI